MSPYKGVDDTTKYDVHKKTMGFVTHMWLLV